MIEEVAERVPLPRGTAALVYGARYRPDGSLLYRVPRAIELAHLSAHTPARAPIYQPTLERPPASPGPPPLPERQAR